MGAASLVRFARNGQRLIVATAAGVALALDGDGRPLWRTNGGLTHSDMGSQRVVHAPRGLLLIDPNAGASFEQNWAKIGAAGLDPHQVKYVLLTQGTAPDRHISGNSGRGRGLQHGGKSDEMSMEPPPATTTS